MNRGGVLSQDWLSTMVGSLKGKSGRRILKNVAALSIAQSATYLLPLAQA